MHGFQTDGFQTHGFQTQELEKLIGICFTEIHPLQYNKLTAHSRSKFRTSKDHVIAQNPEMEREAATIKAGSLCIISL